MLLIYSQVSQILPIFHYTQELQHIIRLLMLTCFHYGGGVGEGLYLCMYAHLHSPLAPQASHTHDRSGRILFSKDVLKQNADGAFGAGGSHESSLFIRLVGVRDGCGSGIY